jgi:hypothetical protein
LTFVGGLRRARCMARPTMTGRGSRDSHQGAFRSSPAACLRHCH